jgi:hypothetical protein
MANFESPTLTRAGRKVLAQGQIGLPIRFTRVAVGDGELTPGTVIDEMPDLINIIMNLPINGNTIIGDGTTQIDCVLSNSGMSAMLELRELGLFALDNDEGAEVLYAYTNAGDFPDYIPAGNGSNAVELLLSIVTVIKQAEHIVVEITDGYGFITPSQLETRMDGLFGPYRPPAGLWTFDDTAPLKLRPAALPIITEKSLIGYDPASGDFFAVPMASVYIIRGFDSVIAGGVEFGEAGTPLGPIMAHGRFEPGALESASVGDVTMGADSEGPITALLVGATSVDGPIEGVEVGDATISMSHWSPEPVTVCDEFESAAAGNALIN